ncbi:Imm26 family immunity protein [Paractinoplanes atraurantiacus]|uniref:Immunity protein 26 n=1 Tax=Paractinoplanes atraurantiacus TaxID=1036182 RepID=A0A285JYM2_9ACTN|nr:Imm26 family immunity protein [Actinoplanes atraurantiacus]SNY65390.1 Immunity protein 26 [Actinoplanes atraurantiacus]
MSNRTLGDLVEAFTDDLGAPPTLGEVLEILVYGVSAAPSARIEALVGTWRYRPSSDSRVATLNDAAFVHAAALLAGVAVDEAATVLLPLVQAEHFADVDGAAVTELVVRAPKRHESRSGDVLAIPLPNGRYRIAVVLTRNRFGTAIGPLRGTFLTPRTPAVPVHGVTRHIYTDDAAIAEGRWRIVGHDDRLRQRFPAEPEIYHRYAGGETAAGVLRPLDAAEEKAVGLDDPSFSQAYSSEEVDAMLGGNDPRWA